MSDEQVQAMVYDAERAIGVASMQEWPMGDLCRHVLALADERERLRAGLEAMLNNESRTFRMVRAVLDGADVRRLEDVEAVSAGTWKAKEGAK